MSLVAYMLNVLYDHYIVVILTLLIAISVFYIIQYINGKGTNPFQSDTSRAPEPLVTDRDARSKVIKQALTLQNIPDNLDAIVIGSGIGGLTTAAILAKAGKKVLVLEQLGKAGGCCHTFAKKGYEFDVGIHYIGELKHNTINKLLLDQLTEGQLQWHDLDQDYDVVAIGEPGKQKMYPHVEGREKWRKKMIEMFPEEVKAIDRYMQLLYEVKKSTMGMVLVKILPLMLVKFLLKTGLINLITSFFKYSSRTLQEVLDELTENKELKAVLAYAFGDYGSLPRDTSFAMHAMLISHFQRGASYPVGGASEIAFHIIPVIERAGGKVLMRARVKNIVIDNQGRASGVTVVKGQDEIKIHASCIVSCAGVVNTFNSFLPQEIASKTAIHKLLSKNIVKSGVGAISLFLGLRGSKEELGIKKSNIWAFTDNDIDVVTRHYLNLSAEEAMNADVPLMFVSFPSAKDPTLLERNPDNTTCTVITLANWSWFSEWKDEPVKKRGEKYNKVKEAIGKRLWEQTCQIYPQLRDKVEYYSVGSPATNHHYIASPKGEMYGLDHDLTRFTAETLCTLRPEVPEIPNLYLSGQDIFTCGFTGALYAGLFTAGKILERNVYFDLIRLKKEVGNKIKIQ